MTRPFECPDCGLWHSTQEALDEHHFIVHEAPKLKAQFAELLDALKATQARIHGDICSDTCVQECLAAAAIIAKMEEQP